jgi:hypothetical protein
VNTTVIDAVEMLANTKQETFQTPKRALRRGRLLCRAGFQVVVSNCTVYVYPRGDRDVPRLTNRVRLPQKHGHIRTDGRVPPNPSGLCGCGCGQATPIATAHNGNGIVRGEHVRYVKGHQPKPFTKPSTITRRSGHWLTIV